MFRRDLNFQGTRRKNKQINHLLTNLSYESQGKPWIKIISQPHQSHQYTNFHYTRLPTADCRLPTANC
jgi:hypothetical protein